MSVTRVPFGESPEGALVEMYGFSNTNGVAVRATSYGATIVSIRTPDRAGRVDDVVLGFDSFADYLTRARYFGSIVGRYGNRIARGRFSIDGATFQLTVNNGQNHLHGGVRGFDRVIWKAEPFDREHGSGVMFTYLSVDGEEGYPGAVTASVTYTLTPGNELVLEYAATTDKPTPINLTNHTYFNLAGRDYGDILRHRLTLHASHYIPTDAEQIPTGAISMVAGTPFDFRNSTAIGDRIDADHEQLRRGHGYDHTFVIEDDARVSSYAAGHASHEAYSGTPLRPCAHVVEPTGGRTIDVTTSEPGVQFYTGNNLNLPHNGFGPRTGFCLETQHFPDSPNQPAFPSTILRPGMTYRSKTVYTFGVTA
jgi:aldose 1-epimerase